MTPGRLPLLHREADVTPGRLPLLHREADVTPGRLPVTLSLAFGSLSPESARRRPTQNPSGTAPASTHATSEQPHVPEGSHSHSSPLQPLASV